MLYSRWIALAIFLVLVAFIVKEKRCSLIQKFNCHGMAFLEGMVGGFIIDSIGVNLGYYYFPREPIYSLSYFGIVLPCWGVFGMLANFLWEKLGKSKFWLEMVVTYCPLLVFYEGANSITGSWVYMVSPSIVLAGWFPLVLTFAGCHRRRRVVWKVEEWIRQCQGQGIWEFAARNILRVVKVLLIVVMFPLLFTSLARLVIYYSELKKRENGVRNYLRQELMMGGIYDS